MNYLSMLAAAIELAKFVPTVVNRLKGVRGATFAEKLVAIAKKLTNETSEERAVDNLRKNPSLVIEFQKLVMEIDAAMYKTSYKEHKNARLRDMEMMKAGKNNLRAHIMVIIAAVGLISCPIALVLSLRAYNNNIPGEIIVIISTIGGIFGSCLKDAYAFEFGSSKSINTKNDIGFLSNRFTRRQPSRMPKQENKGIIRRLIKKVANIRRKISSSI